MVAGGHAWLQGDMHGCEGACVVAGAVHGCRGACYGGKGDTVNEQADTQSYWNAFLFILMCTKISKMCGQK